MRRQTGTHRRTTAGSHANALCLQVTDRARSRFQPGAVVNPIVRAQCGLLVGAAFGAAHGDVEFVDGRDEHGCGGKAVGHGDHEEHGQFLVSQ